MKNPQRVSKTDCPFSLISNLRIPYGRLGLRPPGLRRVQFCTYTTGNTGYVECILGQEAVRDCSSGSSKMIGSAVLERIRGGH